MSKSDILGENGQLAIIVQLNNAPDHATRANLLLHCPKMLMLKYRSAFERACETAGLQIGIDYIEAWSAALSANCGPSGNIPDHLLKLIFDVTMHLRKLAGNVTEHQR